MKSELLTGILLAGSLLLFGGATFWFQFRGWKRLQATAILPSDDRSYFRKRYLRRGLTAIIIMLVGGMIGGAYLSGMEQRVEALKADPDLPADQRKLDGDNEKFVQFWGAFWVVVIVLVFTVVGLAFADALATRRYAMHRYRTIREDHEVKLRRDLAVYVAQKQAGQRAGRMGNRTNDDDRTDD